MSYSDTVSAGMIVTLVVISITLLLAPFLILIVAMRTVGKETAANRYYGKPLAQRQMVKRDLAERGRRLMPLFRLLSLLPPLVPTVRYRGMITPRTATDGSSVRAAAAYEPDSKDVFVATQMKCGTTWMQQLVYEVMMRGRGDCSDAGHGHLYATSPWLEAIYGVPLADAPRLGPEGMRVIKTHLPADICPYSSDARYIYVTRHPVACFASTVDFFRLGGGVLSPSRAWLLDWFLSDRMWWRSWPEHVDGWWRWSQQHSNVLFVRYEAMLADLPGTVSQVAAFLNISLSAEEQAEVARKSSFAFMKAHEEQFEMTPPSLLSELAPQTSFPRGTREREHEGALEERQRIMEFCHERLAKGSFPLQRFYAPG
jgi:hypothetical protein